MNKNEILKIVQNGLKENVITANDLSLALKMSNLSKTNNLELAAKKPLDFGKIFSLVGGLIVFFGLSFLIGLYWSGMNSFLRVGSTLGVGLFLFSIGSYLIIITKQRFTGLALHLVAPILIAFGFSVLLNEFVLVQNSSSNTFLASNFLIYLFIFGLYFVADRYVSSKLFSFVSWVSGTVAYSFLITFLINFLQISTSLLFDNKNFALFGLLYCVVMYFVLYLNNQQPTKKIFNDIVLFVVNSYLLCTIFWILSNNLILESLFSLVLFYSIFVSIKINKIAILISCIFGIIFYLVYLSSRYFSNTLGWPISLIIIGLGFVGTSFLFVNLKSRFKALP